MDDLTNKRIKVTIKEIEKEMNEIKSNMRELNKTEKEGERARDQKDRESDRRRRDISGSDQEGRRVSRESQGQKQVAKGGELDRGEPTTGGSE